MALFLNDQKIDLTKRFPDHTLALKAERKSWFAHFLWLYEDDAEFMALMFLTKHLRSKNVSIIDLTMPYIPNARMDRVRGDGDVFTLKYFAEAINDLHFNHVVVLDPHSHVAEALFENIVVRDANEYIAAVRHDLKSENPLLFYPDEGAMKRYSDMVGGDYSFGIKKRDWETGKITDFFVADPDKVAGRNILVVDDICSRGGTFMMAAEALKKAGAQNIYLYVTHCENTVASGNLLDSDLICRLYTTHSIYSLNHEKVKVID